jgi:hypothetical protein
MVHFVEKTLTPITAEEPLVVFPAGFRNRPSTGALCGLSSFAA